VTTLREVHSGAADAMLAKATNVAAKNTDNFILLSSVQPLLEPYLSV
jgi:3-polyprenyl-4-hydroxybenzoate decarboxylase